MVYTINLLGPAPHQSPLGTFVSAFGTVVREDCDCYVDGQILFKVRKNQIPPVEQTTALEGFLKHAKKKNDNRGIAAGLLDTKRAKRADGNMNRGNPATSGIVGFYDKPPPHEKGRLKRHFGKVPYSVCRMTAFNKNFPEVFDRSLPFFQRIDSVYRDLAPEHHARQTVFSDRILKDVRVPGTSFTTITCNYNWQTACHVDSGDFPDGLGNLTVVGNDQYEGGYIGFPEWDIGVDVRSGDVIIMDVHRVHCNIPIVGEDPLRLSFVCYTRTNMVHCRTPFEDVFVSEY